MRLRIPISGEIAVLGGLLLLSAWGTGGAAGPAPPSFGPPSGTARIEGDTFPKTLVESDGHRTRLLFPPRRIASVMLATDEILLDLLPPDRIVAVTHLADDPGISNAAAAVHEVPARVGSDVEPIVALEPDLVLVARFTRRETVDLLRAARLPVFRVERYDTIEDIRRNIRLLGEATGREDRAGTIVSWMDRTLVGVRSRVTDVARPRVLYLTSGLWTAGKGTIFDELLRCAGGRNAAAEAGVTGHRKLSLEAALGIDPDVILVPAPWRDEAGDPVREIVEDPVWAHGKAVRDGRVHAIPSRWLTCISHHVVRAAPAIGATLHPDRFPAGTPLPPPGP